mmetsp:Transcript_87176/g.241746  ORF Transcript_87176/g.241746 Transcript_87176/m.241746 type:complete len:554 (-) Transcript_87176:248-1909(-)
MGRKFRSGILSQQSTRAGWKLDLPKAKAKEILNKDNHVEFSHEVPGWHLGSLFEQRFRACCDVLGCGSIADFQYHEHETEVQLRILEAAALCYRKCCNDMPVEKPALLRRVVLALYAKGGVLGDEPRSCQWPHWCRLVEKDFNILAAVRFNVNVEHLCSSRCFDRHQLYFGRSRIEHALAEMWPLLPESELLGAWKTTLEMARRTFREFDCVLIQSTNIGKDIVQKLATQPFEGTKKVDVEGLIEMEELFKTSLPFWLTAFRARQSKKVMSFKPGYVDKPAQGLLWWQLPSMSANCQSLTTQAVHPYCDPCAITPIDKITDEVAMDVDSLARSVLHGDISEHLREAYVRHLWETTLHVFKGLPSLQARLAQCDVCRQIRPKAPSSCVCGLTAYCGQACQAKDWKSGHNKYCRKFTKDKWHALPMSSAEQLLLRQRVGIQPDAVLSSEEELALRMVARKGGIWDDFRAELGEEKIRSFYDLLQPWIGSDDRFDSIAPIDPDTLMTCNMGRLWKQLIPRDKRHNLQSSAWACSGEVHALAEACRQIHRPASSRRH